ncbi:MAG: DNA-binding protein [Chloroflexi bacterium]|nr:MAG: DNA-binding protein [Chloroflexota bacterium]
MSNYHPRHKHDIPRPPSLELYTIGETAAILGVSRRSVSNWIRQGALKAIRLGPGQRMVRIQLAELEAFIQRYQFKPPAARPPGRPYDPVNNPNHETNRP